MKMRYSVLTTKNGEPSQVAFWTSEGIRPWTESKREAEKEAAALRKRGQAATVYVVPVPTN